MGHTVEHRQSIVAVSVTGSLVYPTLFSHRDANCIYRPSILRENCDTDWSLPLLDHTEGGAMDAAGFSILDNRACVTFGVECAMGCAGDGDRSLGERHCATT